MTRLLVANNRRLVFEGEAPPPLLQLRAHGRHPSPTAAAGDLTKVAAGGKGRWTVYRFFLFSDLLVYGRRQAFGNKFSPHQVGRRSLSVAAHTVINPTPPSCLPPHRRSRCGACASSTTRPSSLRRACTTASSSRRRSSRCTSSPPLSTRWDMPGDAGAPLTLHALPCRGAGLGVAPEHPRSPRGASRVGRQPPGRRRGGCSSNSSSNASVATPQADPFDWLYCW